MEFVIWHSPFSFLQFRMRPAMLLLSSNPQMNFVSAGTTQKGQRGAFYFMAVPVSSFLLPKNFYQSQISISVLYWRHGEPRPALPFTEVPQNLNKFSATHLRSNSSYWFALKAQSAAGWGPERVFRVSTGRNGGAGRVEKKTNI